MLIKVRVLANAKKEHFRVLDPDTFQIEVRQKAERNEANHRVRELLARHFGISVGKVTIVTGHKGRNKIISIPDN